MSLNRMAMLTPLMCLLAACQGYTESSLVVTGFAEEQRFMQEFGEAIPPVGYVSFCEREPGECESRSGRVERVEMNAEQWVVLNDVNMQVNGAVSAATDQQIYNQPEYWTLPETSGDCEDYVLQKRKLLISRGWPQSTLSITVVRDENREGHAVLSVLTDMGDLILDNKTDIVRPWSETSYIYYKRQSRADPQRWVALTPLAETSSALAATRARRD